MTDTFEHSQKKTDDIEAKAEPFDTQSRRSNLNFPCVQGDLGFA